jgi:FixJ family two-component response regulator
MSEDERMVFIVDDDESVRKSLQRLINAVGLRVEAFATATEFLQRQPYDGPACLVLDVLLPGLHGLALQETLVVAERHIPIVFITAHGDIPMGVQAMKAGAVDFLTKPFSHQDFLDAVERAITMDGRARQARAIIQDMRQCVQKLTPREHEVFALVVTGMLNKEVAAALGTSEQMIKVHRAHLMQKMQVQSFAQLVQLAVTLDLIPAKHTSSLT